MGRSSRGGNRDKRPPVSPVEKINLSEDHLSRKAIVCIVCLVIGVIALCFAVKGLLSTDPGWTDVEVSTSELNCSGDFTFCYLLGQGENSATVERKQLTALYTEGAVQAYRLFNAVESFDGVHNVWYLNQNPNQEIVLDPALYQAFATIQASGNRSIYLGPAFVMYQDLFFCEDDAQILDFDPYQNSELAAYYQEIAGFAQNPDSIDLELLGDNTVRLNVSAEYLQYAAENGITTYVDFSWMKNAFIVDYLADLMTSNGFTNGYFASFDGFFRSMNPGISYSFDLYDRVDGSPRIVGRVTGQNAVSRVFLRNYPISTWDTYHYYQLSNGDTRFPYLDIADGLCKSAVSGMVSYSDSRGCAETLLNMIPVYVADSMDQTAMNAMTAKGIYSVYVQDAVIWYNDRDLTVEEIYSNYSLSLT